MISAILLLLRQKWRQSINRFAEAMTLFAVACAVYFRCCIWDALGMLIGCFYPSTMGIQPQFRSPLVWDVFAVSTYFTISLLFWYVGLIPDLATMRDQAASALRALPTESSPWVGAARRSIGIAMRWPIFYWRGWPRRWWFPSIRWSVSTLPWPHPGLALDDFSALLRGGAIYSGFAMVLTLAIPLRKLYGLEDFITLRHLKNMGEVMLATGLIVAYGYLMETFMAWYSGNIYEQYMMWNRMFGPYCGTCIGL